MSRLQLILPCASLGIKRKSLPVGRLACGSTTICRTTGLHSTGIPWLFKGLWRWDWAGASPDVARKFLSTSLPMIRTVHVPWVPAGRFFGLGFLLTHNVQKLNLCSTILTPLLPPPSPPLFRLSPFSPSLRFLSWVLYFDFRWSNLAKTFFDLPVKLCTLVYWF